MKTFRYLIAGLLLLAALPSQSKEEEISVSPVSYTHLTLPTNSLV